MQQGIRQGETNLLCHQIAKKYSLAPGELNPLVKQLSARALMKLSEMIVEPV